MEYYKTIIVVEVLSQEPIPDNASLEDIAYEGTEGEYSLIIKDMEVKEINRRQLKYACKRHGTDPSFFLGDEEDDE